MKFAFQFSGGLCPYRAVETHILRARWRAKYLRRSSCLLAVSMACVSTVAAAQMRAEHRPCKIHPTQFEGWAAEEMSNEWVHLMIVPQLGGRLMQVEFAGHAYLFVNPKYEGK